MSWEKLKLGEFLINRDKRFKPNDNSILGLKRIDKIDFSGKIFLSQKPSNTDMILVKKGDLVISGINVEKGAMSVYQGDEDVTATIHYSSYTFNEKKIDIDFLKLFLRSSEFKSALKEQVPGGIKTEIKPKHLLHLEVVIPNTVSEQKEVVKSFAKLETQNFNLELELSHQNDLLKQLRQAFLKDAMQAKLVRQNLKEGNAIDLLNKIKADKEKLIAEKKLKKETPLPPIKEEEIPFGIPKNWVWCRLGDIVTMTRGRFSIRPRNDPSYFGGKYPFIQIGSLDETGSVITEAPQTLNEKGFKVSKEFPKGTIVIAIVGGTIGNLGVLGIPMCFTDSMIGILPSTNYNQDFILNFLRFMQPEIKKAAYQMAGQPNIKIPTLTELLFPLPPLEEQTRILKKLEEVMNLCEELKTTITGNQNYTDQLLQVALKDALQPKKVDVE